MGGIRRAPSRHIRLEEKFLSAPRAGVERHQAHRGEENQPGDRESTQPIARAQSAPENHRPRAIEDVPVIGLPRACTPELHLEKCSAVIELVHESHPGPNAGVYATAG